MTKGSRRVGEELPSERPRERSDASTSWLPSTVGARASARVPHHASDTRVVAREPHSEAPPSALLVAGKFRLLGAGTSHPDERAFKALHVGTGRRVELRMPRAGVPDHGPEADRLLRGARAAGRAPHPNLLNVVDSGLDPVHGPFVVYEQFAGVPASELVSERGPWELAVAAEIVSQVLDGLSALHARGLHHRQLRPECVLIAIEADEVRVKLTGLGYSAQREREAEAPELPRGYSRYLAPEARRGAASAPAIDIYAAGVLLRFLLTGEPAPERPLPPAVERALERATAEDPDERFATAEQLRACVRAIAESSVRESVLPSGSLLSDLRFMLQRRHAASDEVVSADAGTELELGGRLELYPILLVIESLYARVGASGWRAILAQVPDVERLLPEAGLGAHHRQRGVSAALVQALLAHADERVGRGNLRLLVDVGEELARRGLERFCRALPAQLTPEGFVACVPGLWRSFAREGDVVTIEQREGCARLAVRAQLAPSLELSALFAGILRGQLRLFAPESEVNLIASQTLGDGADLYVLRW